jgi:large subunit ribosomal protein L4
MKLPVKDLNGKPQGELEVRFPLVENGKYTQAVHDTVVAHLANRRSGNACTKTMGEVNGTGKKPWRQKGTGRARAGSFASPLWRGGGVVFGPKPRDFGKKVNRKTRALALRKALSERLKAGDVLVVNELKLQSPKTKGFTAILKSFDLGGTALVVDAAIDRNVLLASRNVAGVDVTTADNLNTYQVLRPSKLLLTRGAFEKLEARLKED